jgi:dihydrofolate reductase
MPAGIPKLPLVLVAAVADNGVIGNAGGLPWRLRSDLRRFRRITTGHPVVMGRKTYLAIGKPLKQRTSIVLTRDPAFDGAGIAVAHDLDAALDVAQGDALRRGVAAIMVVGGADLYAQTIVVAARLEITRIHVSPDGDARFPAIDPALWREIARCDHLPGPEDDAPFTTLTYERAPI